MDERVDPIREQNSITDEDSGFIPPPNNDDSYQRQESVSFSNGVKDETVLLDNVETQNESLEIGFDLVEQQSTQSEDSKQEDTGAESMGAGTAETVYTGEMDRAAVDAAVAELAQLEEQALAAEPTEPVKEIEPAALPESSAEMLAEETSSATAIIPSETINLKPVIEALLFVHSAPVSIEKLQEIVSHSQSDNGNSKIDKKTIQQTLEELRREYNQRNSAIQILEVAHGWQFCTREEFSLWLEKLAKHKEVYKLSNSALETLAIIAYKQPITRAEVEHIRGVDSGGVIHNLLEKRLVRVTGRKECLGHPLLYGTTNEFLQYFGLVSITDLPLLEDLNKS